MEENFVVRIRLWLLLICCIYKLVNDYVVDIDSRFSNEFLSFR